MLEQVPPQMGAAAVQWAKLVIPLVVHSASKVRLRAAAAMELGMPLLLEKQAEVAAVIEPMMSSVSLSVFVVPAHVWDVSERTVDLFLLHSLLKSLMASAVLTETRPRIAEAVQVEE